MTPKTKNLRFKIIKYANYIEVYIAIFILIGILCVSVNTINNFLVMLLNIFDSDVQVQFATFLSDTLKLVIGVEFVKMLVKHTPESVIDVLLFAIARKLIVETSTSLDLILSVASLAILFMVRKYVHKRDNVKGI